MNKEFWEDFFTWMEGASRGGLFARRDELYELRRALKGSDVMPDIRRMIRLIDEELVARAEVASLERRRKRQ